MNVITRLYYMVAPYVDVRERRVARFFAGLREHRSMTAARKQLQALVQYDLAVVNLWTEHRYKGYDYLRKAERRRLYENLQTITIDFDAFWQGYQSDEPDEHRKLLQALTAYFSDTYTYRASSTFGRLLHDPTQDKLVGDCNQIVTLYIHLFARYCDVTELQLRLLPGHVALHYNGIDIEATNGTFVNYDNTAEARLVPVEEIVSINLLDTTDENFAVHEIPPEDFLQAARFAYMLSHERDIVAHNLDVAYSKIVTRLMGEHRYDKALVFAKQSKTIDLLATVGHNAAVYYIRNNKFALARKFAAHALKRRELLNDSYHTEGAFYYNQKKYAEAIKAFAAVNDAASIRKCYEGMFFAEQEKLPKDATTASIAGHRKVISRMYMYARKSGNTELIAHAKQLRKYAS